MNPVPHFLTVGVKDTSRAAHTECSTEFRTIEDRIMDFMADHQEVRTRRELAEHFDISTATMSGRVNALLKAGRLVEEAGTFKCNITGRNVTGVSAA